MTITITNKERNFARTLIIDRNTIAASAPGNINPTMTLGRNSSHVIRINKNSISTYNVEFLAYILNNNSEIFNAVYHRIKYVSILNNSEIERINSIANMTVPAFYNSFNDDIVSWLEFFKAVSHETKQAILYDHFCANHESKMKGIISASTYIGKNEFCLARRNNCPNAICIYCYANSLTNQRQGLKNKLIRLHMILTTIELAAADIPAIDSNIWPFFRFESFGDINNVIQVNNYNLIASVNADINFTLWTKNPGIIQAAINNGMTISDNLIIGLSSLYLNTPEIKKAKKYSFIRFLFTVYNDNYIREHNIKINCGAKHCLSCGICYDYLHRTKNAGGLYIINERKK